MPDKPIWACNFENYTGLQLEEMEFNDADFAYTNYVVYSVLAPTGAPIMTIMGSRDAKLAGYAQVVDDLAMVSPQV